MNHEECKVSEQTQTKNASSEATRIEIAQAIKDCFSKSAESQKRGCNVLKELLTTYQLIDQTIDNGVVPQLVRFLKPEVNLGDQDLLRDALLALGNIAGGTKEHTNIVVRNGTVAQLVELLGSSEQIMDAEIVEHIVWVLVHIAYDHAAIVVQEKDLFTKIVNVCDQTKKMRQNLLFSTKIKDKKIVSTTITQTLYNLSGFLRNISYFAGDKLDKKKSQIILQTIASILSMCDEINNNYYNDLIHECIQTIDSLIKKDNQFDWKVEVLIKTDILSRIVRYLNTSLKRILSNTIQESTINIDDENNVDNDSNSNSNYNLRKVMIPATYIFSNLCAGNCEQTQYVINSGFLQEIVTLLTHIDQNINMQLNDINSSTSSKGLLDPKNKRVLRHIIFVISNISAGTVTQTQSVIDCGILKLLIKFLPMDRFDLRVKKEIAWTLKNATRCVEPPRATNMLTWKIERLCWIAYLKNSNDNDNDNDNFYNQCLLSKLPKDIMLFILSFFNSKFDNIYTKKQINWQEKRYLQVKYLVDECGLLNAWFELLFNLNFDQLSVTWLDVALVGLQNLLDCGQYWKEKNGLAENKYCSMFENIGGLQQIQENENVTSEAMEVAQGIIDQYWPYSESDDGSSAGSATSHDLYQDNED